MAKKYEIEIVLDGQRNILNSFEELESAYLKVYQKIQANKLETRLDEKVMNQNLAELKRLESAAEKMGQVLKGSTHGVAGQWEIVNGSVHRVVQTMDAAGKASSRLEDVIIPSQKSLVSGYNAVGNSLNQLTREAPAFAVSAATGFLAISNNLPILFDALSQAKSQNKSMFAEFIKGLFSWQTALSVGVTALTIFGGKIWKAMTEGSVATQKLKEEQKKFNEEYIKGIDERSKKFADAASKELTQLGILFTIMNDTTRSIKDRNMAMAKLNETQADNLKYIGETNVKLTDQGDIYERLTLLVISNSIAKAASGVLETTLNTLLTESANLEKVYMQIEDGQNRLIRLQKEYDDLKANQKYKGFNEDAYKVAEEMTKVKKEIEEAEKRASVMRLQMQLTEHSATGTASAFERILKQGANSPFFKQFQRILDAFKNIIFDPNSLKPKGSTKKPIDYKQFQGSLDDIIKMTRDIVDMKVDGTWIDVENGIRAADVALEAYLSTFKGYNQAAKDAAAANKKLDDESTVLFQKKAEVEANRQKGLLEFFNKFKINPAAFNQISDDSKNIIDGIIKDFDKGLITIEQASARMVSKGGGVIDVYGLAGFQSDIAKFNVEIEKNRKEMEKNQKIIDKNQGADAAAARVKYENIMLDIRKKAAAKEVEFRDKAIKAELDARDEAGKELVRQGLATFEINAQAKKTAYEKESRDALDALKVQLAGADKIFQGLFREENGLITYNEDDLRAAYGLNGGKYASELDDYVSLMDSGNAKMKRIESSYLDDLKNLNLEFIQDYLTIYRDKNATELYEMEVNLEHQKIVSRDAAEVTFRETEKAVEKRRKKKKKQSDEELRTVLDGMRNELKANDIFYDAELKLATEADKRALIEAEKLGYKTEAIKLSIYNTERELTIAHEQEILSIREKYSALIDETNKKTLQEQINDWTSVIQAAQEFANALIDFATQQNQNTIDQLNIRLQNTEEQYSQTLSRISSLEDELEGKRSGRRDAVLQALELEREREIKLANEKIALADRIAKEERKIRKREQAAAIAESIINGALAITNVLATTPPPLSFVLAGIMAATTAVQTATIASQKFAKGGFTGSGGQRDETGHKVAGVVHNDEWVAPKWMVESPKFGGMINQLENARTKGFANGGFTSPDFNSLSQSVNGNSTAKLESMMRSYMETNIQLANRPLFVSATEVQNVNTNAKIKKASVTI